jgi:hypothetical protein
MRMRNQEQKQTVNVKGMCDVRMTMEKWEITTNRKKRLRKER